MICTESLERRSLFAGIGLDTGFGTDGTVLPASRGTFVDGAVLASGDSIFTATQIRSTWYVTKLFESGERDTSWGNNGVIETAFEPKQFAIDSRTGLLYAGGEIGGAMSILRLTTTGRRDRTFGPDGVVTFSARDPITATKSDTLSIASILPVARRRVLIAYDREVRTETSPSRTTGTNEILLMQLASTGRRDVTFGSRGVVPLLSGTYEEIESGAATNAAIDTPTLHDLRVDGAGYRAVLSREYGRWSTASDAAERNDLSALQIKSRYLSAGGTVFTAQAYSWNLQVPPTSSSPAQQRMIPLLAESNGGTGVSVVARRETGDRTAFFGYTLAPGQKVGGTPFGTRGLDATDVVRNDFGYYFAADADGTVARFRPDFSLDRRFAARGLGRLSDTVITSGLDSLYADDEGRLLAGSDAGIDRFG